MRQQFLPYLRCPETDQTFKLTVFEDRGGHVWAGLLTTNKTWYPIIQGIPRILIKELKDNLLQIHQDFLTDYRSKLPKEIAKEWQQKIDAIADLDAFLDHQKKTAESFA